MNTRELRISRARELRKNQTNAEKTLWSVLRKHRLEGHRFRRQHPIGRYIVDFVCLESRLVVELDGGQHQESIEYDEARAGYLKELGFSVIRFWNNQVLNEMYGVQETILLALSARLRSNALALTLFRARESKPVDEPS
jgi:very-short-patch-repair endonuclease